MLSLADEVNQLEPTSVPALSTKGANMMITFKGGEYVVSVLGCIVGRFDLFDEALEVYFELNPDCLAA